MSKEYYMDYRFFIKAKDWDSFLKKIQEFLPDSNDDIWYTPIKSGIKKEDEVIEKPKEGKKENEQNG